MEKEVFSSWKKLLFISGVLSWVPSLCGAIPGRDKYPCLKEQYVIINVTTNQFIRCFKCEPCELGRELVVPCGSIIGIYVSTGDCKPCETGFYSDQKGTQRCKKCKRYSCFEHQVGEGECPTKENRDGSYCTNKCRNGDVMNKNGTQCDPTRIPNLNSSALNHTKKHVFSSTKNIEERPATTHPKTNPITNTTPAKGMNPVTVHHPTKPSVKLTAYFSPKHATNHKEDDLLNPASSVNTNKPEISNHSSPMPVWAIVVIITVFLTVIILAMIIAKWNVIKRWWKTDEKVTFHREEIERGKELETKLLLEHGENKEKEKIDEERKKDVKIYQQEEKGETEIPKDPVHVPETSSGYANSNKAECDMNTCPPSVHPRASQCFDRNRANNGYMNSGRSSPMNSPGESQMRNLSQPIAPVYATTNGNGNNITTILGSVHIYPRNDV